MGYPWSSVISKSLHSVHAIFLLLLLRPAFISCKHLFACRRLIYGLLEKEFQEGLHALNIVAKTPKEIERANKT
jgi:stress-induced morphogen